MPEANLSVAELRAILEAGEEVHGPEKIAAARAAMQAHDQRVTGKWIRALGLKIVISLAIVGVLLAIYITG